MRAYEINENGTATIDMTTVAWKCRQTLARVRTEIKSQAKLESVETLRRCVKDCAGTALAKYAADELARRGIAA